MTRHSAFPAPFFGLRSEIDRLFEDALNRQDRSSAMWAPAVDVRETDEALTLEFELPGVTPDDVEVTCENGVLQVRGEKRQERKEKDEKGRYHLVERQYGSFTRSFQLPHGVDEDAIEAEFEEGLLSVTVPKAEIPKPRRIQIGGQRHAGGRQVRSGRANGDQDGSGQKRSERQLGSQGSGASEDRSSNGNEDRNQGSKKRAEGARSGR